MNDTRRKALRAISEKLAELKDELESIQLDEEEYRDSIPENLQGSDRYEKADAACDVLYSAVGELDEAISDLDLAVE